MRLIVIVFLIQCISILALKSSSFSLPSKVISSSSKPLSSLVLQSKGNDNVFSNSERIESIKVGVISAVGGSLVSLPLLIVNGALSHFDASWELSTDLLALSLGLYGLTYRYAVRKDTNPQLQQGTTIAFVLTRILPLLHPPSYCSSLPLNCGPPLYYGTISMVTDISYEIVLSLIAFFSANYIIEYCFKKNILSRFPKA